VEREKYSILAVDGGGIRGVIPARVLEAVEERLGRPISSLFDLIAGTSTGGIIALGLTRPGAGAGTPAYTASDLLSLYRDHGREIFPDSILLKVRTLGGLADPHYPAEPLEELLQDRFGATKLSDALTEVVIPAYDLSGPSPFFFKRTYARDEAHSWDVDMWLVARATSAAPTYFDPARLPAFADEERDADHALVDGGVYANNPAASAYADALDLWGHEVEIQVVSIGTGLAPQQPGRGAIPVAYEDALSWGLARWAQPVLEVVFDGVAKAVEYQMIRLCRHAEGASPRYHRMQSSLPTAASALDDASERNVERLVADAETLLHEDAATFDAICEALEAVAADRDAAQAAARV
jgi:predicted acylesterase/phospholipase RssA